MRLEGVGMAVPSTARSWHSVAEHQPNITAFDLDGAKQKRRCFQRRSGAPSREPAHFDWRWRERPALALLAWEALARDPSTTLRRTQGESIGTTIDFGAAAITHRDIAPCGPHPTEADGGGKNRRRLVDPQSYESPEEAHNQHARSCGGDQVN
jgi:hypothetical protein